ncbi:hypothetical protein CAPTEDRAFT_204566 [Capitella teleta]|uniref:G-protein coupled receptors family 1 profile domain-containing protein n=1 Tax=Capitella teleta TaxID=283909 RepID=R7U4C1_CAPTE|nr:hypothetical protein CAPTEDRAFT_204566 [Capitella teleta]|eukprot:ELT98020.1 hypothetical protein CAPTEDRAFT_204566 [Capitella teleta]
MGTSILNQHATYPTVFYASDVDACNMPSNCQIARHGLPSETSEDCVVTGNRHPSQPPPSEKKVEYERCPPNKESIEPLHDNVCHPPRRQLCSATEYHPAVPAGCVTIVINPITLMAMSKQKILSKSAINLFIGSLCCSDFLLGMSVFFCQLPQLLDLDAAAVRPEAATLSCASSIIFLVAFLASNVNVFLIGVDRACATLEPFSYKTRMTIRRAIVALCIGWITSFLIIIIPFAIIFQQNGCTRILPYPYEPLPESYIQYFTTPMCVVGLATNVVLYAVIIIAFYKVSKKVQPTSHSEMRNQRMTRMVTILIGVLLIGNIPIITVATMPATIGAQSGYAMSYQMYYDLVILVVLITTSCNNFIYVWQLPDFDIAFKRLFSCKNNRANNTRNLGRKQKFRGNERVELKPKEDSKNAVVTRNDADEVSA